MRRNVQPDNFSTSDPSVAKPSGVIIRLAALFLRKRADAPEVDEGKLYSFDHHRHDWMVVAHRLDCHEAVLVSVSTRQGTHQVSHQRKGQSPNR
jgi:hypothetical protein